MIFRYNKQIGKLSGSHHKRSRFYGQKDRSSWGLKMLRFLALSGVIGGGSLLVIGGIVVFYISRGLPDVDSINTYIPPETTKIYSSDGVILAELHEEENRIQIPLEQISPILRKTVVAIEDKSFWNHNGIDFRGMFRALYRDVLAGSFVEGASTLTQQLARNLFLYKRKKLSRKLSEIVLAVDIERKFTKEEILELYLNQVYWGHNSYGIESASQLFFGKHASELTVAESAGLVGMLRGPELFSPFRSLTAYKERQKVVLDRMKQLGLLTQAQLDKAYDEPVVLAERKTHRYKAPFFTSYVVQKLLHTYGEEAVYTSGMKVYTTLDYGLQEAARNVIQEHIELGNKPHVIKGVEVPSLNYTQAAIMAVEPDTGYIRVLQGGVDFTSNEFNRCTQAMRQPGSAFKPFVYLTALQQGFSPGSIIDDSPVTFSTPQGPYSPVNYTMTYSGPIPMSKALEKSVNIVAIKLNEWVGPENVIKTARRMGIKSPLSPVLSLPLGAHEVTMMELVSAYMVLANNGIKVEPVAILRIEDRNGVPLYKHRIKEQRVLDANPVAALVEMMEGVVDYGTGRAAKLPRPIAGKTGTTSDYKDAWFVGFVPQLVCATWVGNDDNRSMNQVTGGWIPAQMWREFMKTALNNVPTKAFPKASNVVERRINADTGLLVSDATPEDGSVYRLKYWVGKEPNKYDTPEALGKVKRTKVKEDSNQELIEDVFDINR